MALHLLTLDHYKLRSWRRYIRPFVQILGGYSPFPMLVTVFITFACNLNCEMCCQQQSIRRVAHYTNQMALEDFVEILTNLERSFPIKPRLLITGGEPTINREFLPMVRYAIERGFTCSITSNGALLEQAAEELVALVPYQSNPCTKSKKIKRGQSEHEQAQE